MGVGLKKETGGRRRATFGNDEGAKSEYRINEEIRMTKGLGRRKTHGLRIHPTGWVLKDKCHKANDKRIPTCARTKK